VAEERTYRRWLQTDLRTFEVRVEQSDLLISAERLLPELAERALRAARADLEAYLARDPEFERSLSPRAVSGDAPEIVREMARAAEACGVGPMAAVAGAVAQRVGEALLAQTRQVIVENGGDIYLYTRRPRVAAVYAGLSPITGRLGLRITRLEQPVGLCTSSGTVGPSLSFGRADAAVVLAGSAALADAAATALGNRVTREEDIEPALQWLASVGGVLGGLVVLGERVGAWGEIELTTVARGEPGPGKA